MRRSLILFCLSTLVALGAQAQMSLKMTADKSSIVAGGFVTYTITLTNEGGGAIGNPAVSILVPGFSSVNFLGPGCTANPGLLCTTATLPAGETTSFTVSIRHFLSGTATVSAKAQPNVDGPNPVTVDTDVAPRRGDLALTASALTSSVSVGGTLTYRTSLINHGPDVVENVLLALYLPPGVFASSVPIGCADSHSAIQCFFGAVSPNSPIPLTFSVKAPADAGTLSTDFALITTDIDTDLSNNGKTIDTTVFKTAPGPNDADLAVSIAAPTIAANGDTSFTVSLTNKGPAKAANFQIDFIAENQDVMLRTTSSPFVLNCSGGFSGGSCSGPFISAGATVTATFVMRDVNGSKATGDFLAHVSATPHDPDPSNNDAVITVNAQP
jgi:uncharacterized repeat protein (TIGR01451 family)